MNSKIIVLVVAVLLAGGLGFVLLLSGDDNPEASSGNADSAAQTNLNDGENFLNIDTNALVGPYKLSVEGTSDEGSFSADYEFDGNGDISGTTNSEGVTTGFRVVEGVTYVQSGAEGEWFGYPASSDSLGAYDYSQFTLSDNDINEIKDDASLKELGDQSCSAGKCRAWQFTYKQDGGKGIIRISKSDNRVSEVEASDSINNTHTKIVYSYPGELTIAAPEGAVILDVPGL